MLRLCRRKLDAAGVSNAEVLVGDISDFRLEHTFDFIIAPYRVLQKESLDWEVPIPGGRVACYVRRSGIDLHPLVLHPELIYRVYREEELIEEVRHRFVMRCYYPDELVDVIRREGFRVTATFGGYEGEAYGAPGTDQVVEFEAKP
jgi:hypothetical protein